MSKRCAIYARVSTQDQEPANQLLALRAFAEARSWAVTEYVDVGVSGAKERRPELDRLMAAVRSRKVDVVCATKLDRIGRSLSHLLAVAAELEALACDLVVTEQAIDTTVPAGRLMFSILGAVAQFERELIRDRVIAGMKRAKAQGVRLGRPQAVVDVRKARVLLATGKSLRLVAREMQVAPSTLSAAVRKHSLPAAG
jgi:DNA invertase Pin-like site-specific DNA recombinase